MSTKQIVKELTKLVNDKRVHIVTSRFIDSDNQGLIIGVYFGASHEYLGGYKMPMDDDLDYIYFFDALKFIQSVHPTRKNDSVLVQIKVDSKKKTKYRVTDQSDYEFFNVSTFTNMSDELNDLINEIMLNRTDLTFKKVYDANYSRFIATYDYSYTQDFVI